jgi:hypothetical protein
MKATRVYYFTLESYIIVSSYHYPYLQAICRKHLFGSEADKANIHSEGEFI